MIFKRELSSLVLLNITCVSLLCFAFVFCFCVLLLCFPFVLVESFCLFHCQTFQNVHFQLYLNLRVQKGNFTLYVKKESFCQFHCQTVQNGLFQMLLSLTVQKGLFHCVGSKRIFLPVSLSNS